MPKQTRPTPAPLMIKLKAALDTCGEWWLHYYQLLYFQEPPLTSPAFSPSFPFGRPFTVRWSSNARNCLEVVSPEKQEYNFLIRPFLNNITQEQADIHILNMCDKILAAIKNNKQKPDSRVCCGLAETVSCMCEYAYKCELHGGGHIGSHD